MKKMKIQFLIIALMPTLCFSQWNQLGKDIDGKAAGEQFGTTISLNANGKVLVSSAPRAMENSVMVGKVSVFDWKDTAWVQKGADILGTNQGDIFGESVSLSADGNTVAIGAPGYNAPTYLSANGPTGYTRIFDWNGTAWVQRGTDINGEAPNDVAGSSVSLSANGNIIAIGASSNSGANGNSSGHCRIYEWSGSAWNQKGTDIDGKAAKDYAGSVSLNAAGTIIAIGAAANDDGGTNAGHVRVFEWSGADWIQKGIAVNGDATNASLGSHVAMDTSGNSFITGGFSFVNGALGFARVFEWNGTNYAQKGQLLLGDSGSDFFGTSLDINALGNIIGVGALTGKKGYARIFEFIGNSWVQQGTDFIGEGTGDQFGRSLSLNANGNIIAIGTQYNDGNGSNAGHVRVFEKEAALNLEEINDFEVYSIYPNPTQDFLQIVSKSGVKSYLIVSVDGKILVENQLEVNAAFTIDFSTLKTGIYFLMLQTNNQNTKLKIIKN